MQFSFDSKNDAVNTLVTLVLHYQDERHCNSDQEEMGDGDSLFCVPFFPQFCDLRRSFFCDS